MLESDLNALVISLLQKLHNKELNIKQLGFMSMVEFMSAMPNVVRIERPSKLDWLLFLAGKGNTCSKTRYLLE